MKAVQQGDVEAGSRQVLAPARQFDGEAVRSLLDAGVTLEQQIDQFCFWSFQAVHRLPVLCRAVPQGALTPSSEPSIMKCDLRPCMH